MYESEKWARWSRFTAVMQIEWQDHARRSLFPHSMSKTLWARFQRKSMNWPAVISQQSPVFGLRYTEAGWSRGVLSCIALCTMLRLACVGHIQLKPMQHLVCEQLTVVIVLLLADAE